MKALFTIALIAVAIGLTLLLGGCQTAPAPRVITQTVSVPVPVPCPDKRAPFTDPLPPEKLAAAPDLFALAQLYKSAVILLRERLAESDAQISACSH